MTSDATLVIRGVTVVDPRDGSLRADQDVRITGEQIVSVEPARREPSRGSTTVTPRITSCASDVTAAPPALGRACLANICDNSRRRYDGSPQGRRQCRR